VRVPEPAGAGAGGGGGDTLTGGGGGHTLTGGGGGHTLTAPARGTRHMQMQAQKHSTQYTAHSTIQLSVVLCCVSL
jgi:hypothetical protein